MARLSDFAKGLREKRDREQVETVYEVKSVFVTGTARKRRMGRAILLLAAQGAKIVALDICCYESLFQGMREGNLGNFNIQKRYVVLGTI